MSLQPAPQVPQTTPAAPAPAPASEPAAPATASEAPAPAPAAQTPPPPPPPIATFGLRFVPMAEVMRINILEVQTPYGAKRTVALQQDLQDWLVQELKLTGPVTYEHCAPALQLLESKLYAQLAEIKRAMAIVNSAPTPVAVPGGYTESVL